MLDNDRSLLFKARPPSDASLTIRMNQKQKAWIYREAERRGVTISRYILDLVDCEFQRLQSDVPDNDANDLK